MAVSSAVFVLFVVAGLWAMWTQANREHRTAIDERRRFLDPALPLFDQASITHGEDQFPTLVARLPDGRDLRMEVLADTLVPRRLPQLWLKLTMREAEVCRRPTIGILARPTGSEFYAIVPGLPDRVEPPFTPEQSLTMRARGASPDEVRTAGAVFQRILADPAVKEAVIAPGGVRIVGQIAEGDRGAHILFRQVRFPLKSISADLVLRALADAEALRSAFDASPVAVPGVPEVIPLPQAS